jgi:hypothetical protein
MLRSALRVAGVLACTFAVLLAAVATAFAQAPEMPKPGAEQKNLAYFEGTWKTEATMKPSPFGPGGPISATETCRMFEGGWHLVCDNEGSGAMGPMKGHVLMTYDLEARQYRYFAISTLPAAEMATGTFAANTWTWTSEATLDGKKIESRFVINVLSPTSYTMKWESSTDGKSWQTVLEGKAAKAQ